MGSFCVLPFVQLDNELEGECRPCCVFEGRLGCTRETSILEAWNSEGWRELRKAFAAGARPAACRGCWEQEDLGLESYRQQNQRWHAAHHDPADFDAATGRMRIPPRSLVLKPSSLCNLACRMCFPGTSTSLDRIWDAELTALTGRARSGLAVNFPDLDRLREDLRAVGPGLRQVSFSGGEPLLDPTVREVLIALRPWAAQIRAQANTNLSRLQHGKLDVLEQLTAGFRWCILTVSVDGPPPLHGYIRPGLDVREFLANLERLQGRPRLQLDANIAVQVLNALHLPETLDFVLRVVRPGSVLTSLAAGPGNEHLDVRTLPADLKALLRERLTAYAREAQPSRYPMASPQAVHQARAIALQVERFARSADLWSETAWARVSAYHRHLDRIHGTSLAAASPALAARLAPDPVGPRLAAVAPVASSSSPSQASRPLLHVPAYVPDSARPEERSGLRGYVLELLLACLHGLADHTDGCDLLVTTNDDSIAEVVARHRARTGARLELARVTRAETRAAFGIDEAALANPGCARYLVSKLFPIVRRIAPWIVHLDFDTIVRAPLDFGPYLAAGIGLADANRFAAGWSTWMPAPAAADFFGLRSSPRPRWRWLNTGVFSVSGTGFDLLQAGVEHVLRNLAQAERVGVNEVGEEILINALAMREPGSVAVLDDPSDNVLAYYLSRHPTWERDARIVHFHSLKPQIFRCEGGRVTFECAPAQAGRATLEFYLASLHWLRHLHAAAGPLELELPTMRQMPGAFVEQELARIPQLLEARAAQRAG